MCLFRSVKNRIVNIKVCVTVEHCIKCLRIYILIVNVSVIRVATPNTYIHFDSPNISDRPVCETRRYVK